MTDAAEELVAALSRLAFAFYGPVIYAEADRRGVSFQTVARGWGLA